MKTHEEIIHQALLANGDLPGHEFHGNQWSAGAGNAFAMSAKAGKASTDAIRENTAAHHEAAASAHASAAEEHTKVAALATKTGDTRGVLIHEQQAAAHQAMAEQHAQSAKAIGDRNLAEAGDATPHTSQNAHWGFYGTMRSDSHPRLQLSVDERHPTLDKEYNTARNEVVRQHGGTHADARQFLDSVHGRHVADDVKNEHGNIKAAVAQYGKTYKAFLGADRGMSAYSGIGNQGNANDTGRRHEEIVAEALANGDVPGHEFHGNQFVAGEGGSSLSPEGQLTGKSAEADRQARDHPSPEAHRQAARAHFAAAAAHHDAGRVAMFNDMNDTRIAAHQLAEDEHLAQAQLHRDKSDKLFDALSGSPMPK